MSGAVQAVIGVVEIVAGAVLDAYSLGTIGNPLIMAGVAQLLGYAISLFNNPRKPPLIPIGASYAGTLEPRRIIYGKLKVGGMYTAPPLTSGPNNDFLDMIFTVCGHDRSELPNLFMPSP